MKLQQNLLKFDCKGLIWSKSFLSSPRHLEIWGHSCHRRRLRPGLLLMEAAQFVAQLVAQLGRACFFVPVIVPIPCKLGMAAIAMHTWSLEMIVCKPGKPNRTVANCVSYVSSLWNQGEDDVPKSGSIQDPWRIREFQSCALPVA